MLKPIVIILGVLQITYLVYLQLKVEIQILSGFVKQLVYQKKQ